MRAKSNSWTVKGRIQDHPSPEFMASLTHHGNEDDLTRKQLAKRTGISENTVTEWMRGGDVAGRYMRTVAKVAFHMSLSDFLEVGNEELARVRRREMNARIEEVKASKEVQPLIDLVDELEESDPEKWAVLANHIEARRRRLGGGSSGDSGAHPTGRHLLRPPDDDGGGVTEAAIAV